MKIGIVGHGTDKFTIYGAKQAKALIAVLVDRGDTVVSGHSPMGGVDIWAEEIGTAHGKTLDLKTPKVHSWNGEYGYRARNLAIAQASDEVNVIVVDTYPLDYKGRKFNYCYHCFDANGPHVKSGGCWTGNEAKELGKPVKWFVIPNYQEGEIE